MLNTGGAIWHTGGELSHHRRGTVWNRSKNWAVEHWRSISWKMVEHWQQRIFHAILFIFYPIHCFIPPHLIRHTFPILRFVSILLAQNFKNLKRQVFWYCKMQESNDKRQVTSYAPLNARIRRRIWNISGINVNINEKANRLISTEHNDVDLKLASPAWAAIDPS